MRSLLILLWAVTFQSAAWAADAPPKATAPGKETTDTQAIDPQPTGENDDTDADARDHCVYCSGERSLDDDEAEEHEATHEKGNWRTRDFDKGVVKGFGITLLGGAVLRARPDFDKYGSALGPAGDAAKISGLFAGQAWMMVTNYLRLGADFTYSTFSASGRGPDATGIDTRQTVNYEEAAGGLLAEGVLPLNKQIELSLGLVIGGGHLRVSSLATRIDDFYSAGVDLAAVSKTQSMNLEADFFDFKPALGLKVKATAHVAIDFRLGLNTVFIPRGSLGYSSDLKLTRSPEIIELQPFVQVGASFGAWKF